jgi:hypothetical protein
MSNVLTHQKNWILVYAKIEIVACLNVLNVSIKFIIALIKRLIIEVINMNVINV